MKTPCDDIQHDELIRRFLTTYGPEAIEALDDVSWTLRCGAEYEVIFTSRMYKDALELIQAVGPDGARLIQAVVRAYQRGDSSNIWN
ncbi:MAG: hypothetical protein ABR584_09370 [Candidatus Baltobacteraceae bacterium]